MEGIPVKISEKYKPPKKIILPRNLQNRVNAEIKVEEYDFSLERSVLEKMTRLKELRKKTEEERERRRAELKELEESTKALNIQKSSSAGGGSVISDNPILTPIPIDSKRITPANTQGVSQGTINYSDFESDTSSPFDNMELKTINDMEELAHVLGTSQPEKTTSYQPPNGYNHYNSYYPQQWMGAVNYGIQRVSSPPMNISPQSSYLPQIPHYARENPPPVPTTSREPPSIPPTVSIYQELQGIVTERKAQRVVQAPSQAPLYSQPQQIPPPVVRPKRPGLDTKPSTLPNPINQLSPTCQRLARQVAEMGFSLPRVARTVQRLENDEAKVIEVLLQTHALEESLKLPPDRVEKAFVANNYDEEATKQYLDSMTQLLGLGFDEERVAQALLKYKNDRDKALDFLIS